MLNSNPDNQSDNQVPNISSKLWIYTNYDCNLSCSYCVAESTPRAPKRAIPLPIVKKIIDEAAELGFENVYFTGGEPFILKDIFAILAYASNQLTTTVLTNAMLFQETRLKKLVEVKNDNLIIQVSLDGGRPEHHDPFRGKGSWQKTVDGIHKLLDAGFHVRLSSTETPANRDFLAEICEFRRSIGISDDDHIIRPLAKRGFSEDGMEVGKHNLVPEMTINDQGVYWHPLSTDPDLLVSNEIFPLAEAFGRIETEFMELSDSQNECMEEFQ